MFEFIKLFFGICTFRKGPEDIPHSFRLLQFAIILYAGVGFLAIYFATDFFSAIVQLGTEILLILVFAWGLLSFFEKSTRFYQTTTAFFGVDAVISFCALPLISVLSVQEWAGLAMVLLLLMMFWHLLVTGHIISRALSKSFWFGLLLAFCYIAVSFQIISLFFPPPEIIA